MKAEVPCRRLRDANEELIRRGILNRHREIRSVCSAIYQLLCLRLLTTCQSQHADAKNDSEKSHNVRTPPNSEQAALFAAYPFSCGNPRFYKRGYTSIPYALILL